MKNTFCIFALAWFGITASSAQVTTSKLAPGTEPERALSYRETERGAHHKVWERIEYETTYDGKVAEHRHTYQELATGMHYREGDKWLESEEKIEILPNNAGAAASKGQHKAIFPPEIKSGLIELQMPDQQWMRSRVWGLAYFDSATGKSVLLAEVKESEGQLVGDNVVVYPDAFTDFLADIRYTYTRAGFEQDIVLREQPPAPEKLGLNPKTTRLQVLTEFVDVKAPIKQKQQTDGLADETLGFGPMSIGAGKAFGVDTEGEGAGHVPVAKQWEQLEGRDYLIEEVLYEQITDQLQKLPAAKRPDGASLQRRGQGASVLVGLKKLLPKKYAKVTPKPTTKRMARITLQASPSFVMDYVSLNSTQTNFTFKADTTYYLSASFSSFGTNTFEGGTVLKYATNAALNITPLFSSPVIIWLADAYRPVVFTAVDDNSVGETISGSSGNPTGPNYANPALGIVSAGSPILANFRIAYAKQALNLTSGTYQLWHGQILNCGFGITGSGSSPYVANSLFASVRTNFNLSTGMGIAGENVTFNGSAYLTTRSGAGPNLTFTNCVFANITNLSGGSVTVGGGYNGFYSSFSGSPFGSASTTASAYPFQTVGGGAYYLTNDTFRNVGTTNLNAGLVANLPKKTTYPPIAYTNTTFTAPMTLNPQAQRDTDTPDLGYHYDPLDYTLGGCHANSNLTFTAGTAVGWFRTSSGWNHAGFGLHLGDKQIGSFDGTVTAPCYWVRLNTVQENDRTAGYGPGGMTGWAANLANAPDAKARFTRFSMMAGDGNHVRDDNGWLNIRAQDSEFFNGGAGGYVISMYFTNCLFSRTYLAQVDGNGPCGVVMRNCTMIGNQLQFVPSASYNSTYKIWDCAFDGVTFQFSGPAANTSFAAYDYNAYTNASNPFPVGGSHNVTVSSFNWQTNWLGNYYLPTNSVLTNAGSVTAPNIALYHYTTQTNQVKETTSQVDIGYHYVAVNSSGLPIDTDGDGLADYYEDTNGNGSYAAGDLANWNAADTDSDGMNDWLEVMQGRNPNVSGTVADTSGIIDLKVFTPLK